MSAHNGCIYVWGGQHRGQYLNEMIIFDLKECEYKREKGRADMCIVY